MSGGMTRAELLALREHTTTNLETANRALGLGRTVGHAMAREGRYPVPLLRCGVKYVVLTEPLVRFVLGLDVDVAEAPTSADIATDNGREGTVSDKQTTNLRAV